MKSLRRMVVRATRRRYGFEPAALRQSFAALAAALTMIGCASAAKTVATLQNSYDYREARYEERCIVAVPPSECIEAYTALHAYEKHLHEAAKALRNGGGLPLQLGAIKADEKALGKMAVTK